MPINSPGLGGIFRVDDGGQMWGTGTTTAATPTFTGIHPMYQGQLTPDPLKALMGLTFHVSKIENGMLLVVTEPDGSRRLHFASEASELSTLVLALIVEKKLA